MNTLEAIAKRKSTRSYRPEVISEEALDTILKAGFASPIAMARYDSLHITVVQNEAVIKKINDLTSELFTRLMGEKKNTDFGAKTLVLVSSAPKGLRPKMEYVNVGIVVENMVLAATDLGIDSVIVGGAPAVIAENEELMRELEIPEGFTPTLGAFFGYATTEEAPKVHTISVNRV